MAALKPLTLYKCGPSPNPWKVAFILAELALPHEFISIPITNVKNPEYVAICPNGRVPILIDPNNNGITLWESGSIIEYLIETYDTEHKLHYTTSPEKFLTRTWAYFQISGQGPYFGQKAWFDFMHPEKVPSAIERYRNEIKRVNGVLDDVLAKQGTVYLVGDKITYADLMFLPYAWTLPIMTAPEIDTSGWTHYNAWLERLYARPAVRKVLKEWIKELSAPHPAARMEGLHGKDWQKKLNLERFCD